MKELIESVIHNKLSKANDIFEEKMKNIVSRKLNETKKIFAAKLSEGDVVSLRKPDTDRYTVGKYQVSIRDSNEITIHEKNGKTHVISDEMLSDDIKKHVEAGEKLRPLHIDVILRNVKGWKEVESTEPTNIKEDAKKAALEIVNKRPESSKEKVERFGKALTDPGTLTKKSPELTLVSIKK